MYHICTPYAVRNVVWGTLCMHSGVYGQLHTPYACFSILCMMSCLVGGHWSYESGLNGQDVRP